MRFSSPVRFLSVCLLAVQPLGAFADWPMHRGNPRLDGCSSMSAMDAPKEEWSFSAGKPVKGGAAIGSSKVYVGDDAGLVHALDLDSGKEQWAFKTEGPVEATPLLLNGLVLVGSGDGKLYALESANGAKRWEYVTGDKIMGGANTAKAPDGWADWIFVGSYDAQLHCVDAATGKEVWTLATDNYINGTPALLPGGELIFGGCDAQLRIVSTANGKQVREIEAEAYVASSVAVAPDGGAYVGHYGNLVLGLDVKEAKVSWRYRDRNFPYVSSAAVAGERVFIGGGDKRLHCIERATGRGIWQFATRGKVDGSPVVCDQTVVVGSADGRLYGIAVADGQERWVVDLGSPVSASPAVSDGWIIVGTEDGVVHGLRQPLKKP
jgi:outer membrane protein assembly factor BamB